MIAYMLLGSALTLGVAQADTTFAVDAGTRLRITNRSGSIEVRGWDRSEVRVRSSAGERSIQVTRAGSEVRVSPRLGWDDEWDDDADLRVDVPRSVQIDLHGGETDIDVRGTEGAVRAETLEGDIRIQGGRAISARTVEGDVRIADSRGAVAVNTAESDITIRGVTGDISVEGIEGDISLVDCDSRVVEVTTISGDVLYDGRVHRDGQYHLATHDGDVTFALPDGTGASVSVSTFDGSLRPSFPIALRGSVNRFAEFTIGDGGARVELESFDGDIYLVRPGQRPPGGE